MIPSCRPHPVLFCSALLCRNVINGHYFRSTNSYKVCDDIHGMEIQSRPWLQLLSNCQFHSWQRHWNGRNRQRAMSRFTCPATPLQLCYGVQLSILWYVHICYPTSTRPAKGYKEPWWHQQIEIIIIIINIIIGARTILRVQGSQFSSIAAVPTNVRPSMWPELRRSQSKERPPRPMERRTTGVGQWDVTDDDDDMVINGFPSFKLNIILDSHRNHHHCHYHCHQRRI